jgi:hypothetical protein
VPEQLKADFGIEVRFTPGTPDPSRVFRSMTALIDSFKDFDHQLVQSIDIALEPVLLLEDIEVGSLRTWLRSVISSVDDSSLKSGDWKKVIGDYLVRAKYIIVSKLEGKTQISNRAEIQEIETELLAAAEATDIKRIPSYRPVPLPRIIDAIEHIDAALANLASTDSATLLTPSGNASFNMILKIAPDSLKDLLVKEHLTNDSTLILKVKRPDYLGDSMWDFKLGEHPIQAKITDREWLADFQSRKIDVRPGDALRATVRQTIGYGYDADVVYDRYEITKVSEVISTPSQPPLLGE